VPNWKLTLITDQTYNRLYEIFNNEEPSNLHGIWSSIGHILPVAHSRGHLKEAGSTSSFACLSRRQALNYSHLVHFWLSRAQSWDVLFPHEAWRNCAYTHRTSSAPRCHETLPPPSDCLTPLPCWLTSPNPPPSTCSASQVNSDSGWKTTAAPSIAWLTPDQPTICGFLIYHRAYSSESSGFWSHAQSPMC